MGVVFRRALQQAAFAELTFSFAVGVLAGDARLETLQQVFGANPEAWEPSVGRAESGNGDRVDRLAVLAIANQVEDDRRAFADLAGHHTADDRGGIAAQNRESANLRAIEGTTVVVEGKAQFPGALVERS